MSRTNIRLVGVAIGALALQAAPAWADHAGGGGAAGGGFGPSDAGVFARDVEPPASWLEYSFELADLDRDLGELLTHRLQGSYAFRVGPGTERNVAVRASWPIYHLLSNVERNAWGSGDLTLGLWWNALRGGIGGDPAPAAQVDDHGHSHHHGHGHAHAHAHAEPEPAYVEPTGTSGGLRYNLNLGLTTLVPIGDRDRDFSAKDWGNGAIVAGTLRYGPVGVVASGGLSWLYDGRRRPTATWSAGPALFLWSDRVSLIGTVAGEHLTDGRDETFRAGGYRIFLAPAIEVSPFTSGALAGLSIGLAGRWQVSDTTRLRADRAIPLTEPDLRSDVEAAGVLSVRFAF